MKINNEIYKKYVSELKDKYDDITTIIIDDLNDSTNIIMETVNEVDKNIHTEREEIETPEYIKEENSKYFTYIENQLDIKLNTEDKHISLDVNTNEICFKSTITHKIDLELNKLFSFDELSNDILNTEINTDTIPIEDNSLISHIHIVNLKPEEVTVLSPDMTIYFETQEPHKYWMDCDTLEDYVDMVLQHKDDLTKEELLNKDVYYSHFHLSGHNAPIELCAEIENTIIEYIMEDSTDFKTFVSSVDINKAKNTISARIYHTKQFNL